MIRWVSHNISNHKKATDSYESVAFYIKPLRSLCPLW